MALAALGAAGVAAACGFSGTGSLLIAGGDEGGTGPDAVSVADAGVDGSGPDQGAVVTVVDSAIPDADAQLPIEAGPDGGCPSGSFKCTADGTCVTKCRICPGTQLGCATTATCVGTCAQCAGHPFECIGCTGSPAIIPSKTTCEVTPATCNTGGVTYCDCMALMGCFGHDQICIKTTMPQECRGCGDLGTDGAKCVGGTGTFRCAGATSTCK